MGDSPQVSGERVVRALERAGWVPVRSGATLHRKLRHPQRPGQVVVSVGRGKDVPPGTLRNILAQAGMTVEELKGLL